MGVSTDAKICLGIAVPEGYEFPWDKEDVNGDCWKSEDDWWLYDICKYKPSFKLYDENGERVAGTTEADVSVYYKEKSAFEKAHPMPFDIVRHCSDSYVMYLIAVPNTLITSWRGDVTEIDMEHFYKYASKSLHDEFSEMCKQYFPSNEDNTLEYTPKWFMVSWWG